MVTSTAKTKKVVSAKTRKVVSPKTRKVVSVKTKKTAVARKPAAKPAKKGLPSPESMKKAKKLMDESRKGITDNYINDLEELARVMEANPSIIPLIREVFEYNLKDPIDRKTFPRIVNAMSMLLGSKVAMVIMLGCHLNSLVFFEELDDSTKNNAKLCKATNLIKHLTSIYGDRIQHAYTLSAGTVDEDWNSLDINTYKREGEDPLWLIDMKISLYNGTETTIKMIPNSAFQFIAILMKELIDKVPNDQIEPELIENYKELVSEFNGLFYFDDEKEKNNHPEGYA